jgi:hypothetical protein
MQVTKEEAKNPKAVATTLAADFLVSAPRRLIPSNHIIKQEVSMNQLVPISSVLWVKSTDDYTPSIRESGEEHALQPFFKQSWQIGSKI